MHNALNKVNLTIAPARSLFHTIQSHLRFFSLLLFSLAGVFGFAGFSILFPFNVSCAVYTMQHYADVRRFRFCWQNAYCSGAVGAANLPGVSHVSHYTYFMMYIVYYGCIEHKMHWPCRKNTSTNTHIVYEYVVKERVAHLHIHNKKRTACTADIYWNNAIRSPGGWAGNIYICPSSSIFVYYAKMNYF